METPEQVVIMRFEEQILHIFPVFPLYIEQIKFGRAGCAHWANIYLKSLLKALKQVG